MTPFLGGTDLTPFMRRHMVATSLDADHMTSLLSSLFSPYEIRPLDRAGGYETALASTLVKSMRVSCLQTTHESVGKSVEDSESYSLSFSVAGQTRTWLPGLKDTITTFGDAGRLLQRPAGAVTIDGDHSRLINLWVPKAVLQASLQQLLGDAVERSIEFYPQVSAASGAGATLRRTLLMAILELSEAESSFSHPFVAVRFEEFIAHTMLSGLPHNFSDFLTAQSHAAAPRNVIRALDFIKAHAAEPLTIAEIAGAAGCSTRALQLAFRAWRDTTPMRELNRVRLEYAHADLLKYGLELTVTQVALKWGFGHPGRFAQQYAQAMGQSPSQTQRFGMNANRGVPISLRPLQPR
jgi:AraC-like DNA-binding protein